MPNCPSNLTCRKSLEEACVRLIAFSIISEVGRDGNKSSAAQGEKMKPFFFFVLPKLLIENWSLLNGEGLWKRTGAEPFSTWIVTWDSDRCPRKCACVKSFLRNSLAWCIAAENSEYFFDKLFRLFPATTYMRAPVLVLNPCLVLPHICVCGLISARKKGSNRYKCSSVDKKKICPCSLFICLQLGNNKHSLCRNKSQSMGNCLEIICLYRIICFCNGFAVHLIKAVSRAHLIILSSILISVQQYSWLPFTVK